VLDHGVQQKIHMAFQYIFVSMQQVAGIIDAQQGVSLYGVQSKLEMALHVSNLLYPVPPRLV
jgi:hypothetical protein